jgi:hypothetical protein
VPGHTPEIPGFLVSGFRYLLPTTLQEAKAALNGPPDVSD